MLQPSRGWTDDEWSGAEASLVERDWLDDQGQITVTGRSARQEIEDMTDRLAAEPWVRIGEDACDRLAGLLLALARSVVASGVLPALNPIGMPPPE